MNLIEKVEMIYRFAYVKPKIVKILIIQYLMIVITFFIISLTKNK